MHFQETYHAAIQNLMRARRDGCTIHPLKKNTIPFNGAAVLDIAFINCLAADIPGNQKLVDAIEELGRAFEREPQINIVIQDDYEIGCAVLVVMLEVEDTARTVTREQYAVLDALAKSA